LVEVEIELLEGVVAVQAELRELVADEIEIAEAAVPPQVKLSQPFPIKVELCFCG
jgi:hypothetical protein